MNASPLLLKYSYLARGRAFVASYLLGPLDAEMENANPVVYASVLPRVYCLEDELDDIHDDIDSREIFGEFGHRASYMKLFTQKGSINFPMIAS